MAKVEVEKVGYAAILHEGIIHTGARHNTIVGRLWSKEKGSAFGYVEGFLTSTGRFVGRKEAAEIAFTAGQIRSKVDLLDSKDLY